MPRDSVAGDSNRLMSKSKKYKMFIHNYTFVGYFSFVSNHSQSPLLLRRLSSSFHVLVLMFRTMCVRACVRVCLRACLRACVFRRPNATCAGLAFAEWDESCHWLLAPFTCGGLIWTIGQTCQLKRGLAFVSAGGLRFPGIWQPSFPSITSHLALSLSPSISFQLYT